MNRNVELFGRSVHLYYLMNEYDKAFPDSLKCLRIDPNDAYREQTLSRLGDCQPLPRRL
jgi:hypothetical protein